MTGHVLGTILAQPLSSITICVVSWNIIPAHPVLSACCNPPLLPGRCETDGGGGGAASVCSCLGGQRKGGGTGKQLGVPLLNHHRVAPFLCALNQLLQLKTL